MASILLDFMMIGHPWLDFGSFHHLPIFATKNATCSHMYIICFSYNPGANPYLVLMKIRSIIQTWFLHKVMLSFFSLKKQSLLLVDHLGMISYFLFFLAVLEGQSKQRLKRRSGPEEGLPTRFRTRPLRLHIGSLEMICQLIWQLK